MGPIRAVDNTRLPNFLILRNCPWRTHYARPDISASDAIRFFSSPSIRYALVIECRWFHYEI